MRSQLDGAGGTTPPHHPGRPEPRCAGCHPRPGRELSPPAGVNRPTKAANWPVSPSPICSSSPARAPVRPSISPRGAWARTCSTWICTPAHAPKGETMLDTIYTLEAMNTDVFVIRDSEAGMPEFLIDHVAPHVSVVSAGEAHVSHPTQGLLDALTIRTHKRRFRGAEGRDRGRHQTFARGPLLGVCHHHSRHQRSAAGRPRGAVAPPNPSSAARSASRESRTALPAPTS